MKTMKKAVSLLLCLILLAGTAAAGGKGFADALASLVDAISVKASAASIDDLTYEINNGEVTITMCDRSATGEFVIPDTIEGYPVKTIGAQSFSGCDGLTSITIPDSVTSIGDSAFYYCTDLTSVTIPDSVKSIGYGAFICCIGLSSITIPDSVTSIASEAFRECTGLTSITVDSGNTVYHSEGNCLIETESKTLIAGCKNSVIPNDGSVKSIGDWAFICCTGLSSINIPDSVTSIAGRALAGCTGLTSITVDSGNTVYHSEGNCLIETESKTLIAGCKNSIIPDDGSVTSIGCYAFDHCTGLTSITIPDSVTSIDHAALAGCTGLTSITIPDSVTSIGDWAFDYCTGLTNITISDSVTSIGNYAFSFCTGITDVYYTGTEEQWNAIDIVEEGNERLLNANIYFNYSGSIDPLSVLTYEIIDGEVTITGCDSSACGSLEIPDTIEGYPVKTIGDYAFFYCSWLTSITIPDSVTSINDYTFCCCVGLTSISIPNSVTSIGDSAFKSCNGLASITVAQGNTVYHSSGDCLIETLNKELIVGCKNSIIPDDGSVTKIGGNAFRFCPGLTNITIPGSVTSIEEGAFAGCNGVESITVSEGNPVYHIEGNCIIETESRTLIAGCKNSVVPDDGSVTSIGNYALSFCSELINITIPDTVTSIGEYAFNKCSGLTSISIPNSATRIGGCAFQFCSGLTNITIPGSVTSIGEGAFIGCYGVESITVSEGNPVYHSAGNCLIETESKELIAGCKSSVVPDDGSVTTIRRNAFEGCSGLTSITIPKSVLNIGDGAFSDCTGLTSIIIPQSVKSIDDNAFYNCEQLTDVYYSGTQDEWNAIIIGENWNEELLRANIHYNYIDEPDPLDVLTYEIVDGSVRILRCDFTACGRLIIPASIEGYPVTAIGDGAFSGCDKLISITIPDSVTGIGDGAFEGCTGLTDIYYQGTPEQWAAVQIGGNNAVLSELIIHFVFYNLGEETYSFVNYKNRDYGCRHLYSGGHCFGMAVTSSGYYLGILDKAEIGGENKSIHSLGNTAEVRNPICHYLKIQGSVGPEGTKGAEREAIVAGGSIDLTGNKNTRSDWNACVNYVKDHKFDYKGTLNVGMWYAAGGGHAVNFLYYKEVGSQERIYVYDNNYPDREMYYYMGADGYIHEKSDSGSSPGDLIKGMDLMDVATYFEYADAYSSLGNVIYAKKSEIAVENAERSDMKSEDYDYVIYRFSGDEKVVVITPLVDNAEFEYMGVTYSFNDIDEDTYGVIDVISAPEEETERTGFKIENAPPRVQIGNFVAERTEDYRTTMTFKAEITDPNDDVAVHWFINGSDEGTGETFTVENAKADYTVQAKFINKTGEVVHESETETVKIKHGFFDMLIWFFKHLFNPGAYIKEQ